ncbi:alpha/beta fold hydrolase [Herbiconiux sp. UC225_62]|uniref:alpha/beta fold hydrolase n=1 Tax=Herbiconiux sp. UC225_62 TaxID=3350168 RepID=UPI0036D39496
MSDDRVVLHIHDHPALPGADWPVSAAVLVHGWSCDSSDWAEFVPELRAHARVVVVDLRGHGDSPDGAAYDAPTMAADVGRVLDRLGLADVLLVGHSAGSEVVMQLAVDRPGLARLAVTVDPAYGVPDGRRAAVAEVGRELREHAPNDVVARYFAAIAEPATLARRHRDLAMRARPDAAREMFIAFNLGESSWHFATDTETFLARRTLPLLAIYRDADRAAIGRRFATRPDDLVLDYRSGHWPHQEHPDRFLADLDSWVRRLTLEHPTERSEQ